MLLIDEFVKYADRDLDGNGKQKITTFWSLKFFFHIRHRLRNDVENLWNQNDKPGL